MDPRPAVVRVHAAWNDWRSAEVRVTDLRDVQWVHPVDAPHSLIHAYVSCSAIPMGAIPHECHGTAPHRLLVCVLKRHATTSLHGELAQQANERAPSTDRERTLPDDH
jgi:hypothetical protein